MNIENAVEILKLLGDPTRLTMLKIIEKEACCVCEFVAIFKISQPAISKHLRRIKELGLVKEERRGQWNFYSLNEEHESYAFLESILSQLPCQNHRLERLTETGERIVCC